MSEDGSVDQVRKVERIVKQIDYRLAERAGEELKHIRSADIALERKEALAEIGNKANEEGIYPDGVLTHRDYYTVLNSVWDLVPQGEQSKPVYLNSAETFTTFLTREDSLSPDTPLTRERGDEVMVWRFKVRVPRDINTGGRKIAFSVESDDSIIKTMGSVVWEKLTEAGLPLVDNRWMFE